MTAGFDELAADGVAALAAMKSRSDIDPTRMGVIGTSQVGGYPSGLRALSSDVRFIIDLYGTPVTVREQNPF